MIITLRPTSTIEKLDEVVVREWVGMTDKGTPIAAWIANIAGDPDDVTAPEDYTEEWKAAGFPLINNRDRKLGEKDG